MPEGSSPSPSGSGAPSEQPSADVNLQPVQGEQPQQDDDPLSGLPTPEEIQKAIEQGTPYAKGLAQLRGAYEPLKTQFSELETKFAPFTDVADRFTTAEEVKEAVAWQDKIFGAYERVDGQLVPATEKVVQEITQRDPKVADYLAADFMNGMTKADDGREIPRIDLALEEIARIPERRAAALKLLGGVEPSSIAPTWAPTNEELEVVNPELQDIYRKLPYDERESLKLNDPEFINRYLAKEKFQADLIEQNKVAQDLQAQQRARNDQYEQQQAENAGHEAVETGFRQVMSEFTQTVVENSKFIAPLDPASPEAQAMAPEQVAQFNQQAQKVNTGVGKFIALATAALAVPDTAWIAQDFLKELGVTDEVLQKFDAARQEYAGNTRDHGELNFRAQRQNGNAAGLGLLQSNARSAANRLKGNGNLISKPIKELFSSLFEMKAGNYNSTLNGAATARPSPNGTGFNPTTAPAQRPQGQTWLTRQEIERQFG